MPFADPAGQNMLKTVHVENFTAFSKADLSFSPGLNVITGESGTGKSHLLKLCYTVLKTAESFGAREPARTVAERAFASNLLDFFRPESLGRLVARRHGIHPAVVSAAWGREGFVRFSFSARNREKVSIHGRVHEMPDASVLFLPASDILPVFPGFQACLEGRELFFDGTWLELARALNPAPLKGPYAEKTAHLAGFLEKVLGATVVKKDNRFCFVSKKGRDRLEAALVAEGHRKLGMLAWLIRNGELRTGSSLFWDAPDACLGHGLIVQLAGFMAELSKVMQVTIATHSSILLQELKILQEQEKLSLVRYFGLPFAGSRAGNSLGFAPVAPDA